MSFFLILIVRGLICCDRAIHIHTSSMSQQDDILKRFGARVRTLRLSKRYSQESFAEKCGLDRTYIGGVERGERNIALRNIEKIARAFDMTLSELFAEL